MIRIKINTVKTLYILLVGLLLFLIFPKAANASLSAAGMSVLDTVANFDTKIETYDFKPSDRVIFEILKPDFSVFRLNGMTDETGYLRLRVPNSQTRQAGIYTVNVKGGTDRTAFRVFPGEMSASASGVYVDKNSLFADGADQASINVRISDDYGNPLQFHSVKLLSSRNEDMIAENLIETDADGLASFIVSSKKSGDSVFTAIDESVSTTLEQRAQLAFLPSSRTIFREIGGDPVGLVLASSARLLAQAGSGTGSSSGIGGANTSVARFEIENLPATVNINEALSFRIKAVNSSGNTVNTYTGAVTFSSSDTNAQLPNTYTFVLSDQGRKTFDLGLSFRTAGSQRLTVSQQNNQLIRGERTVEVLQSRSAGDNSQVRITRPATGTYSVNSLDIEGEAGANARVKIYDNGQQIAEVQSNSSGRFSYRTSLLSDGQHSFSVESNGVQSAPVSITIDSTPARVENVQIEPQTVGPGQTFQLSVRSDPNLSSIRATVGDLIADLQPDANNPGLYTGNLTAPTQNGEYTINVIITDNMGNATPATEAGRITVNANSVPAPAYTANVPSKVRNVQIQPGSGRVALTWGAAQAERGIASYRVYYGTNSGSLNLVSSTTGSSTTIDIANLQNGVAYYFQVVGVDTLGNEGDNRSDMISSIPQSNLPGGVATGFNSSGGASPVLCDPGPCPPDAGAAPAFPEDGPEVIGMIIAALASSSAWSFLKRKR